MSAFDYIALDAKGKEHKGVMEGDTARQVRQMLRDKALMPLEITESHKKEQSKNSGTQGSTVRLDTFFSAQHQYNGAGLVNPATGNLNSGRIAAR